MGYGVNRRTLQLVSLVLVMFFSATTILGTWVTFRRLSPLGPAVLPHYGFMLFLGLAFLTFSWSRSGPNRNEDPGPSLAQGFVLQLAGLWAGFLGCWMVVDALALTSRVADTTGGWRVFCLLVAPLFVYLGFVVQHAGKTVLRLSRQHLVPGVLSPAGLGPEPFVLYLRSARDDTLQTAARFRAGALASGRSQEEQVTDAFAPLGRLVAVGGPGGAPPAVGAIRMGLPEENWQEPLREVMTRARLVVIVLGPPADTMWAVREALRLLTPERLVMLVPAAKEDYEPFRSAGLRAGGRPVALPPHPGAGRTGSALPAVISFGPGWAPMLGTLDASPSGLAAVRNPLTTALKFQLRPVFARLAGNT